LPKLRPLDLLAPFKAFDYYHPGQRGSASIKVVLPALTGRTYADLAIQEGDAVSHKFVRVHFSRCRNRSASGSGGSCCGRHTEGMVWIVEALQRLTR
jgi:hypothetical protein